jgi:alpha-beta hydrolase superfamily lysophospholipase
VTTLRWFPACNPHRVSGTALVVHGLNLRPARMQPLIDCLNAAGVECLALSLHGQGDNYMPQPGLDADAARRESFCRVTFELWRDEAFAAYTIARARADERGVPLLLAGFSLGALCVESPSLRLA